MACQSNLVLYGPVGTGKTHLAVALGRLACMRAIPVRFFAATGLLMRLRRAKREDRLDTELRQIAKARLLIIDEFGYMPIDEEGSRFLFQVISDSYETRSVIYTTNIEFSGWGTRARRQEHGCRVDRPHRAPRQARQIRGRLLPQRARPHDQITKEKGAASSDGAVSAGNQPPMLPKIVPILWTPTCRNTRYACRPAASARSNEADGTCPNSSDGPSNGFTPSSVQNNTPKH